MSGQRLHHPSRIGELADQLMDPPARRDSGRLASVVPSGTVAPDSRGAHRAVQSDKLRDAVDRQTAKQLGYAADDNLAAARTGAIIDRAAKLPDAAMEGRPTDHEAASAQRRAAREHIREGRTAETARRDTPGDSWRQPQSAPAPPRPGASPTDRCGQTPGRSDTPSADRSTPPSARPTGPDQSSKVNGDAAPAVRRRVGMTTWSWRNPISPR